MGFCEAFSLLFALVLFWSFFVPSGVEIITKVLNLINENLDCLNCTPNV
jgi:hypothetical protein